MNVQIFLENQICVKFQSVFDHNSWKHISLFFIKKQPLTNSKNYQNTYKFDTKLTFL